MDEKRVVDDDLNLVEIKGRVMGVFNGQFTRPISPALVYLKIVIGKFIFSPYEIEFDNDYFKKINIEPQIFEKVLKYINCFKPCLVNEQGIFKFKVPKIPLDYMFAVSVKKDDDPTLTLISENNLSFNGINGNGPISGKNLDKLREIIIAVKDKLWEDSYSEPYSKDPHTDPENVKPGVKKDDD